MNIPFVRLFARLSFVGLFESDWLDFYLEERKDKRKEEGEGTLVGKKFSQESLKESEILKFFRMFTPRGSNKNRKRSVENLLECGNHGEFLNFSNLCSKEREKGIENSKGS